MLAANGDDWPTTKESTFTQRLESLIVNEYVPGHMELTVGVV
jgi:hypothetical protein